MSDAITQFKAGDAIPEWLIVAEPMQPGAPRGSGLTFSVGVYVVDFPEAYLLVAIHPYAGSLIEANGMDAHRIYAPGDKPVGYVISIGSYQPLAVNAWQWIGPNGAIVPLSGEQVVRGDRRRGFWRRLFGLAQRRQ